MEKIITENQLRELIEPFLGKPISRSWQGYGSALFLEIGELKDEKGQLSIMIEWSWRVEKDQLIWFGSWSDEEIIENYIPKLNGCVLKNISTFGRLPEISISLSDNIWVNSYATSEGHPEWALFFNNVEVSSKSGRLLQMIKNDTEQQL
jgi:hypothetical protein